MWEYDRQTSAPDRDCNLKMTFCYSRLDLQPRFQRCRCATGLFLFILQLNAQEELDRPQTCEIYVSLSLRMRPVATPSRVFISLIECGIRIAAKGKLRRNTREGGSEFYS